MGEHRPVRNCLKVFLMKCTFLIDSHVHIYSHFDVAAFLNTAYRRMSQAIAKTKNENATLVLMLTETAQDDAFDRLATGTLRPDGWTVQAFANDQSALRVRNGPRQLLLIAGRQIVTKERVEVLALGTVARFEDGQGLDEVLAHLLATRTSAVLPWGVGKWFGPRGARVRALLKSQNGAQGVMFGDNGGRPLGWPRPSIFREALSRNVPVVPGSDPLPIIGAERDVGGFTFLLSGEVDLDKPGIGISRLLFALRGQPRVIGRRKGLLRVIRDQLKLRGNRQN